MLVSAMQVRLLWSIALENPKFYQLLMIYRLGVKFTKCPLFNGCDAQLATKNKSLIWRKTRNETCFATLCWPNIVIFYRKIEKNYVHFFLVVIYCHTPNTFSQGCFVAFILSVQCWPRAEVPLCAPWLSGRCCALKLAGCSLSGTPSADRRSPQSSEYPARCLLPKAPSRRRPAWTLCVGGPWGELGGMCGCGRLILVESGRQHSWTVESRRTDADAN